MKTKIFGIKNQAVLALMLCASMTFAGCSNAWIDVALKDAPVVISIVTNVLSIVAVAQGRGVANSQMATELQRYGAEATADLRTLQTLVDAYNKAAAADRPGILGQIDAALNSASANLSSILVVFHVTDQATQDAVTIGIGLAITTVDAIYSLVPAAPAAKAGRRAVLKLSPRRPMTPRQLKDAFNAAVGGSFPQAVIN